MLQDSPTFSGYSVTSLDDAEAFYGKTLGLDVVRDAMGIALHPADGRSIFLYEKDDHQPATYTVLNFVVPNIEEAVDALSDEGIVFERYDSLPAPQDDKNILRGKASGNGPDIAWFKDPAGNVLSVIEE